jgi:predicted ester cyclase
MATDVKALSRRLVDEVWNKGNYAVIDELMDPNFRSEDPVIGTVDKAGFLETVKGYRSAFPDLKIEIVSLLVEGNFVTTRWIARGTNKGKFLGMEPSNKFAVTTGLGLAEVRNGKFISDFTVYDSLSLLKQLDLDTVGVPTPELHKKPEAEKRA